MDKTVPKLDKFILSRASRRARLIHNADDSEGAEPERLTKTISSRADAAKAAEEACATAVAVLGSFERDWGPDVSAAVASGESDVLAWHERLLVAIQGADRTQQSKRSRTSNGTGAATFTTIMPRGARSRATFSGSETGFSTCTPPYSEG